MSTTPEAIERKVVAKETEVERVKKQLEDAIGDRDRELLLRQELAALRQQLAALQQQLAALQQEKVLLMQQQAETVEQKIVAKEAEVELVKRQLQDASGDRELLLQQQLTALRQELAPLRQEKVLLMQQQAGAAGENMSTTPEAIQRKIVAKETEVERVKKQLEDAIGDRELLLQQQLTALRQELAALQQKEVLLMQQQAGAAGENMSTTPEAIERKIVAKETEVERVKKQLEDAIGDRDRELLLLQELAALQQQLAALQQEKVLLMQQQAAAAAAGDAVGLSKVFEQLEILKQQQSTEQQLLEILKEQQQQLQSGQQQQQVFEQLEILKQQLQSGQQQQLTEQQLLLQLLTEQQQNYQGLILDLFHPTSSIASSKELKRYRDGAFVFYYGSSSFAAYTCMVTGMECSARELVAGHIYRQQWPKSLLAKVGVTLHDPSNIIIMQSQLEKAFDKWQWIVLPDGPDDYKVVEWY
uniref:HNH nuclease domain-containing protein n=1 Tax=Tetradesmus obliquus TaxID=3088 RepID=A0A383V449_TETOB|eukprot:jgi/Sobl393_1/12683/SZX59723.1